MISLFQAQAQRAANRRAAEAGRAAGTRRAAQAGRTADAGRTAGAVRAVSAVSGRGSSASDGIEVEGTARPPSSAASLERAPRGVGRAMRSAAARAAMPATVASQGLPAASAAPAPQQREPAVPPGASMAYNAPFAHPAQAVAQRAQATIQAGAVIGGAAPGVATPGVAPLGVAPLGVAPLGVAPVGVVALCPHCRAALGEAREAGVRAARTVAVAVTGPDALQRAIDVCGGQAALASAIGLTQAYVWNWVHRRSVPAEHCPAIERATRRAVRCEALRPDVDWGYLRALCNDDEVGTWIDDEVEA